MTQLKGWDQYVKEAEREPLSIDLGAPHGVIEIHMPTRAAITRFNAASLVGDEPGVLTALLGPDNAAKVDDISQTAPQGALSEFVKDVMRGFGLSEEPGEIGASSNSSTDSAGPSSSTSSSGESTSSISSGDGGSSPSF